MNTTVDGSKLTQCAQVVSTMGKEIDSLREALNTQILNGLSQTPYRLQGEDSAAEEYDESGWICLHVASSFPLSRRKPGKPTTVGYLSYQISLQGPTVEFGKEPEPLLHVCFWPDPLDLEENYMGPQLEDPDSWKIKQERLIVWPEDVESDANDWWTFTVRLVSLNSQEDLLSKIVNPAMVLLRGEESVETALPLLDGVIKYRKEDGQLTIAD